MVRRRKGVPCQVVDIRDFALGIPVPAAFGLSLDLVLDLDLDLTLTLTSTSASGSGGLRPGRPENRDLSQIL